MRRQAPKGETLALLGHKHHPVSKTLPLLGLLQPTTRAKEAQHAATCSRNVQAALGGVLIIKVNVPTAGGWSPWARSMPKRPDEGVLLLLCARPYHNSVLPLPSQRPSDGLFSPMEVRANHLPMCTDPLAPVRRAWSCTSKATPSRGSSVRNIMAM